MGARRKPKRRLGQKNQWLSFELSYIRAHFFDDIDDGLFNEAFKNDFICSGASTAEELMCEKALLLLNQPENDLQPHKFIGATRLIELLESQSTRKILAEKYQIKLKDFYQMMQEPFYGLPLSLLTQYETYRNSHAFTNEQVVKEQNALLEQLHKKEEELRQLRSSRCWKLTKPFRVVLDHLRAKM